MILDDDIALATHILTRHADLRQHTANDLLFEFMIDHASFGAIQLGLVAFLDFHKGHA